MELIDLAGFAKGFGETHHGDANLFQHWVSPFGPLDLQVGKATYDEASSLRAFYLGFVSSAFGVNPAKLANDFHCGPDCTRGRFDELSANLPKIEKVVLAFKGVIGANCVRSPRPIVCRRPCGFQNVMAPRRQRRAVSRASVARISR